jgi:hypothetical protein
MKAIALKRKRIKVAKWGTPRKKNTFQSIYVVRLLKLPESDEPCSDVTNPSRCWFPKKMNCLKILQLRWVVC